MIGQVALRLRQDRGGFASYVPDGGEHKYAVADLITGYGVAESVRHFYDLFHHGTAAGKTAIIQGWGNVASAAACYLTK
jgi:hypothetical protein